MCLVWSSVAFRLANNVAQAFGWGYQNLTKHLFRQYLLVHDSA